MDNVGKGEVGVDKFDMDEVGVILKVGRYIAGIGEIEMKEDDMDNVEREDISMDEVEIFVVGIDNVGVNG